MPYVRLPCGLSIFAPEFSSQNSKLAASVDGSVYLHIGWFTFAYGCIFETKCREFDVQIYARSKQFHTAPTLGTKVRFIKKRSLLIFDTHRNRPYMDERTYPKLNLVRYYKKENQKVNLGALGTWRNSDTVGVPEFGSRASATSTPNFARFRRIIYYSVPSILMGRPSVLAAGRTLALQLDPIKPDALNSIVSDACLRPHIVNQA